MIQDSRITTAIKASGIKNILLLDDAFDVPVLDEGDYGPLYEFLESVDGQALAVELEIDQAVVAAALSQMNNGEYAEDELKEVVSTLHNEYILMRDDRFDPNKMFSTRLSNNLRDVDPLLEMLRRCKDVSLSLIGRHTPLPDQECPLPDLIFADFYLDGDITSDKVPTDEEGLSAKSASIERLEELLKPSAAANRHPSVILMSSKDVRADAEDYRQKVSDGEGRVFASRFGFIMKSEVIKLEKAEGEPELKPAIIEIADLAADVLLDIIQSHPFGGKLHEALKFWLASVEQGKKAMERDIEQLTLKEFAYLIRFRLDQEGLSLFDYLEWFFGECLLGAIGVAAADTIKRPTRDKLDKHAGLIDGEYDKERTSKVAELYHRARVDPRPATSKELRLGDLYIEHPKGGEPNLWAVLTPDCDLVVRKDGAMAAQRILTVKGHLIPYDGPKSSLAEFIIVKNKQYSVDWKLKDLMTRDSFTGLEFAGTLRPIYAQDLQRRALQDLARIGLGVAPVIRMAGKVSLWVKIDGPLVEVPLGADSLTRCDVYPSRGGSDTTRAILPRQATENLISVLEKLDQTKLDAETKASFVKLLRRSSLNTLRQALTKGAEFDQEITAGVMVTEKMTLTKGWCGIVVQMDLAQVMG